MPYSNNYEKTLEELLRITKNNGIISIGFSYIPRAVDKAREYDDPKLFVWIIIWVGACSAFWYHMDWYTWDTGEGFFDPNFIWKN